MSIENTFYHDVLRYISPAKVMLLARAYMMVELADRRLHQPLLSKERKEDEIINSDDLSLILAWRRLQFHVVLAVVFVSGAVFQLLYFFRILPKRLQSPIAEIEAGIQDAASAIKNPNSIFVQRTTDELEAQRVISENNELFITFLKKYHDQPAVKAYISHIRERSLDLGQRWAEVEDFYRRAKANEDRTESFLRAGFLVRAFGFGTVQLIRQLLVILIIGMSIPWIAAYFKSKELDYQTLPNIIWGIGWTFLFWAITLGITLFFNDKRMKDTWKRAYLASLRADNVREKELAKLFGDSSKLTYELMMILYPKQENNFESVFVYELIASIAQESRGHYERHLELEKTIEIHTKKLNIREKIARMFDTSAQGDAFDP